MTAAVKKDLLRAANELKAAAIIEPDPARRREIATKAAGYFREAGYHRFSEIMISWCDKFETPAK
jgi:hypothetical protein